MNNMKPIHRVSDLREFASAPEEAMKDACECAYNQLSDAEKVVLSRQIAVLVEIHGMGRKSALELLAKVGLWLNENKPQAYPSDEGGFRVFGLKKEEMLSAIWGRQKITCISDVPEGVDSSHIKWFHEGMEINPITASDKEFLSIGRFGLPYQWWNPNDMMSTAPSASLISGDTVKDGDELGLSKTINDIREESGLPPRQSKESAFQRYWEGLAREYIESGKVTDPEIKIGLDYSEDGHDKSCVSFGEVDASTGKLVIYGGSFDPDVIDMVRRKNLCPEQWTVEDETKLNQVIESFRSKIADFKKSQDV